jgi:hypothetical protein
VRMLADDSEYSWTVPNDDYTVCKTPYCPCVERDGADIHWAGTTSSDHPVVSLDPADIHFIGMAHHSRSYARVEPADSHLDRTARSDHPSVIWNATDDHFAGVVDSVGSSARSATDADRRFEVMRTV